MKGNSVRIALLCGSLTTPFLNSAWSQNRPVPAAVTPISKDDVATLPAFVITENAANPYLSGQALSASRVAMDILDIPQTISVVTSDFITDSMSYRLLDAAKYVTPVVESTLPIGGDRYMIRGFQVSHEFIDGVESSGADGYSASLYPYNIERVEIIKGPNAILVPGGSPGGQFNPITKSPIMKDQNSVTLQLAQYFTNAISFDSNKVISQERGLAVRMVGAYWDSEGYLKNHFRKGWMIAPSISYQLSPAHKLVVKAEVMRNDEAQIGGVPVDPRVGSNDEAIVAIGLPLDWSFGDGNLDKRHRETERLALELFSTLGDHVTSRLQLIGNHVVRIDKGGTSAAIPAIPITRNPNTGLYEPGVNWSLDQTGPVAIATSVAAPVPNPSTYVYTRNYGAVSLFYTEAHVKNDYAIKFDGGEMWKSTTITGFAADSSKVQFKSYPAAARANVLNSNLGAITYEPYFYPEPTVANGGGNRTGVQKDLQLYAFESLNLFRDRLLLSGGVSRFFGELTRGDTTGIGATPFPSYGLTTNAVSWGAVVKPIKQVSFFYGYNTSGGTLPGQLNAGTYAPDFRFSAGKQKEYGVKTSLLNGQLTAALSHFEISQINYAVPNSEYYTLVASGVVVPADFPTSVYLNLNSKGWEFETTYAMGKNFTLVGNLTDFKIRQPITNVRVRGVPDRSYAFYGDYRFTQGVLNGFGVNLGLDYKSDVVGENATGFTTTKPLPGGKFVPQQPTFLVAGRTLVNLGFAYRAKEWTAAIQVENLFDKQYIKAAGSRTSAVVGDARNLKGTFTFRF